MFETILYLQANEQIANSIKNEFDPESYEVLVVPSAQEAFKVLNERQVLLTLVDTFIPDMKLLDFIIKCENDYPDMVLNVCVDLTDPKFIGNLIRSRNVKKIHMIPWEIAEIVEGAKASVDKAFIDRDFRNRTKEFEEEEAEFEATLIRLKNSLKRQQYSYNRIETFFNGVVKAFAAGNNTDADYFGFLNACCEKMLKLQTTTIIKPELLEKTVREAIEEVAVEFPGIRLGTFDNCIMGDVSKNRLADIVFCIWLCVYLEATKGRCGEVNVFSRYITSAKCEITIVMKNCNEEVTSDRYDTYATRLLLDVSDEFDSRVENGDKVYELRMLL